MQNLPVKPYYVFRNMEPGPAQLLIRDSDFAHIPFQDGTTTLNYSRCFFINLTIANTEQINFGTIHLAFYHCIINDLIIEEIRSKNITALFFSCLINAKIKGENLLNITFANCITTKGVIVDGAQNVEIKFTEENFDEGAWKAVFIQYYIHDVEGKIAGKQRYLIEGATGITCTSNFKSGSLPWDLQVVLSVSYKIGINDQFTNVSEIPLASLLLRGTPTGKLLVDNVKISDWYLSDFEPKGEVAFYDIEPGGESSRIISFHNSNLDNVKFDRVIFKNYNAISFFRTRFSKAVFTSCDFPDSYSAFSKFMAIPNIHYVENKPKDYEKRQYEMFLQLKKALEETGNIYEAQKLHAISHEALKNIKNLHPWDRAILAINGYSNNHGLSIKRALAGFFLFSIPTYLLYLLSIGRLFNANRFDPDLIGYYFYFVDFTHKGDFLANREELSGWSAFFDWSGKIVVGFFIYQFIAAFRKYGKR